jgi:hypothetical protein
MLKLSFINQLLVTTANIRYQEAVFLNFLQQLYDKIKILLVFCIKIVLTAWAIVAETEIHLLTMYNLLTACESEPLDSHRGSGRIENFYTGKFLFIVKNQLVPV